MIVFSAQYHFLLGSVNRGRGFLATASPHNGESYAVGSQSGLIRLTWFTPNRCWRS